MAVFIVGCADGAGKVGPVAQADAPALDVATKSEGAPPSESGDVELGALAPPAAPADEVALEESEVPVSISFERVPGALGQPLTYLIVQSTSDEVQVNSIDLNRGNCSAVPPSQSGAELPRTLKFGQSMRLLVIGCESVLEVSVDTNTGEHTFRVSA